MFDSFIFYFFVCEKVIGLKVIICIQGHTAVAQISNFTIFCRTQKNRKFCKSYGFSSHARKKGSNRPVNEDLKIAKIS